MINFICFSSDTTGKSSDSVIYLQTSQRLLQHLNEPTVLSIGYYFALTR